MPDEKDAGWDFNDVEGEFLAKVYPLPQAGKALKVDLNQLDGLFVNVKEGYAVMTPKGYPYPQAGASQASDAEVGFAKQKANELAQQNKKLSEQTKQLEEQIKTLTDEKTQLSEKVQATEKAEQETLNTERAQLSEKIVDTRIEKGLMEADKKDEVVKQLSELPIDQLKVIEEDTLKLSKATATPQPGAKPGVDPKLDEEGKLRLSLFGHEEPLEGDPLGKRKVK